MSAPAVAASAANSAKKRSAQRRKLLRDPARRNGWQNHGVNLAQTALCGALRTASLGLTKRFLAGRQGKTYRDGIAQEELQMLPNVSFREVDKNTLEAVLAVTLAPEQEPYVGTVAEALEEARETPEGKPWFRAVFDGELAVGFVMLSWNVPPSPPEIIGPWYLWKLMVDRRYQGRGYGRAIIERVVEIVRTEGAETLFTSYATGPDSPGPFYERVGFSPTGEVNIDGEIIVALEL